MPRTFAILLLAWAASTWAAAQNAAPRPASENLRFLQLNRSLLEELITQKLRLSEADSIIERVRASREAAVTLSDALSSACKEPNPDAERISELGDHFSRFMQEGLAPALVRAKREIATDSPDFQTLQELDQQAKETARLAAELIPAEGPLADHPRSTATRTKLVRIHIEWQD